jgi:hypothetical protein
MYTHAHDKTKLQYYPSAVIVSHYISINNLGFTLLPSVEATNAFRNVSRCCPFSLRSRNGTERRIMRPKPSGIAPAIPPGPAGTNSPGDCRNECKRSLPLSVGFWRRRCRNSSNTCFNKRIFTIKIQWPIIFCVVSQPCHHTWNEDG